MLVINNNNDDINNNIIIINIKKEERKKVQRTFTHTHTLKTSRDFSNFRQISYWDSYIYIYLHVQFTLLEYVATFRIVLSTMRFLRFFSCVSWGISPAEILLIVQTTAIRHFIFYFSSFYHPCFFFSSSPRVLRVNVGTKAQAVLGKKLQYTVTFLEIWILRISQIFLRGHVVIWTICSFFSTQ